MNHSIDWVFVLTAGVSVWAGLMAVTRRNPIHSAMSLLVCFVAFAVVFVRLDAPFLAMMHLLVYTGAILVLFLFIIMLLNLKPEELGEEMPRKWRALVALMCAGMFVMLAVPLAAVGGTVKELPAGFGSVENVGETLFSRYALPFDLLSILVLAAVFGGVVLAKKKL